jgi:hypothetical protein
MEILEGLRLRSLDKQGRKPDASAIIEQLLQTTLPAEEAVPYPIPRKQRS